MLLMLNTSVGMLLITGELPVLSDLLPHPKHANAEESDPKQNMDTAAQTAEVGKPDHARSHIADHLREQIDKVEPVIPPANQPLSSAGTVVAENESAPIEPDPQPQANPSDPPATFFGIGIDQSD